MGVLLMIAQSACMSLALTELFGVLIAAWLEQHRICSPFPTPHLFRAALFSARLHGRAGNWAVAAILKGATP